MMADRYYKTLQDENRLLSNENEYFRRALQLICAPVPPPLEVTGDEFKRITVSILSDRLLIAQRALRGKKLEPDVSTNRALAPEIEEMK